MRLRFLPDVAAPLCGLLMGLTAAGVAPAAPLDAAAPPGAMVGLPPASTATLPPSVAAALARAGVPRDAFVAMVQEVGRSTPRLAWRMDQPANPASMMKLLTTYAGLDLLGPAWTWSTPVWLQGRVHDGVLDGNLVIKGSGDPKLVLERLWLLLRRVRQLGVDEIRGDIVLDDSAFTVPAQNAADFDGEALRPYNVGADALMLNFKALVFTFTPDAARGIATIGVDPPLAGVRVDASVPLTSGGCDDWRGGLRADFSDALHPRFAGGLPVTCSEKVWPVAYADAARYDERAIAGLWQAVGGKLAGSVHGGLAPSTAPSFAVTSPTLAELVHDTNKYSNNVMAQQLFLTLALTQRGSGTPEVAREVLRQWAVERFGAAATSGLVIDNGSGLSRDTRVSARLLTQLLESAWAGPVMSELMSSLPVSGVDGTLKKSRATLGRAHLKTGSLRDVAGIAGYVLANSGRRYVVVAIVNHDNANAARPALDALVQWAASDGAPPPDSPQTP
ncbi:MAG TPA: D-alanyl-D-alanine carboxypeptidase/D-alanyl-D-alanine-endopeptidase [Burkholderiaceae bacterium]|jgi:D-alanyl-D-alanine carboxypeptidase/D-alanyl-D-alanine-endopeptidase (penicillin-binding protein 4)